MIDRWNKSQKKFRFSVFLTSPGRRHQDFESGKYDVSIYDEPSWGWDLKSIDYGCVYENGSEVFFSKKREDESFFKLYKTKRISAIRGYHYAFAGFNNDEAFLNKNYSISLLNSPNAIIGHVLRGRSDIGIITEAFLDEWIRKNKSNETNVYKSNTRDQYYRFRVIVRKNAPIKIDYIYKNLGVNCI